MWTRNQCSELWGAGYHHNLASPDRLRDSAQMSVILGSPSCLKVRLRKLMETQSMCGVGGWDGGGGAHRPWSALVCRGPSNVRICRSLLLDRLASPKKLPLVSCLWGKTLVTSALGAGEGGRGPTVTKPNLASLACLLAVKPVY